MLGGVGDLTAGVVDRHLAALEERLEALGQAVDHLLLAGLRAAEVEGGHPGVDAEVGRPLDGAQDLGRLEQLLGRDASPVQAHPADAALLHERDVQPGRGPVQRGGVAGRPTAEDHDVELLGQDGHLLEAPGPVHHGTVRASRAVFPPFFQAEHRVRSLGFRRFTRPQ